MDDDTRPVWKTDELRAIDDSIANLLRSMVSALAGMFVAFLAAEWITTRWIDVDGLGGLLARGGVFAILGSAAIYLTSARPIRSALFLQQQLIDEHERSLRAQNDQHRLVGRLQSAFEMADDETDAFDVVADALDVVADAPAELLLADSSRAHLHRVAAAADHGAPGCGVETPWACPAVRRSRTMVFEDSAALDACPKLRHRAGDGGSCSATCVPVTVLGTPMGVVHTVGVAGRRPEPARRASLEALAEQAGSRIGVLRAMAASELQAITDPLTGLLNRRSLEAELGALAERRAAYSVAFIDLDHFKDLNDTHGHETGDRALRSFARLLRAAVRDGDLVCRYGGEEFVVVFPESDAEIAEGIVQRLCGDLATAVQRGEVPAFTISAGIAESGSGLGHVEVIRHSDEAMFRAKQAGRNRIERAPTMQTGRRDTDRRPQRSLQPVAGD